MAKSLVTKIVEDHVVEGSLEPAEEVGMKMEDDEVTILPDFSQRERDILLAGGILRQLREKGDEQPVDLQRISGEAER